MAIRVVTPPFVNLGGGKISKWNSVHHPINFECVRKDCEVISITVGGSVGSFFNKITLTTVAPTDLVVGGYIRVTSAGVTKLALVAAKSSNIVYTSYVFTTTQTGGWLNLDSRTNYIVQAKIVSVDSFGQSTQVGLATFKPLLNGTLKINVANYLKKLVSFKDSFGYNSMNKRADGQSGVFYVLIREAWDNFEGDFPNPNATNRYLWVNSTKQIKDPFNFNMGEFVPFLSYFPKVAKFMSAFEKPTYFVGYPFSMTFINSEELNTINLVSNESFLNVNGSNINTLSSNLDTSQYASVNRLMLQPDPPNNVAFIDIWLSNNGAAVNNFIDADYVEEDYLING
jgi:hypothetical protein